MCSTDLTTAAGLEIICSYQKLVLDLDESLPVLSGQWSKLKKLFLLQSTLQINKLECLFIFQLSLMFAS